MGKDICAFFLSKHKTAKTYGPATLYLKGLDLRLMEKFMGVCATVSPDEPLLIRSSGTPYSSHYQRYLQQYCRYCGIDKVPTITQYRKAGSTVTKQALPQGTMPQVLSHMGHSSSMAERYYQTRMAGSESLSAYREISNITPDPSALNLFLRTMSKNLKHPNWPNVASSQLRLAVTRRQNRFRTTFALSSNVILVLHNNCNIYH